jgi:hypothetical protein
MLGWWWMGRFMFMGRRGAREEPKKGTMNRAPTRVGE